MTLADPGLILDAALWTLVPALILAASALYVAYLVYDTRQARAERARNPPPAAGPDPLAELRAVNAQMTDQMAEGRVTLEKARETLRRGIKG